MLLPNVLSPQIPRPLSFSRTTPFKLPFLQPLKSPAQFQCHSTSSYSSSNSLSAHQSYDFEQEHVVGDCIVFEDGISEDPYLETEANRKNIAPNKPTINKFTEIESENLVPDQWREVQAELNISKKQRRKIAQEIEFGCKVEKRKQGYMPLRDLPLDEYKAFREAKLKQLSPVVLDNPTSFPIKVDEAEKEYPSERVAPKDPRWAVYGRGLDDVREVFNSGNYEPGQMNSEATHFSCPRKLFTKEEKVLLNKKIPNLSVATSDKWLPVHTLAASGEFYLLDALLKHADVNCVDKDGFGALHKAIIGKKHAITNYLLRESANPFTRDKDGASLLHYAVQTGSGQAVKILLLYNVDINLQDNDGWTALHVAVQTRRTDMVQLLLIKGADKTIKNKDGLSPLDLCLYWGRDLRTYQLIKLLKLFPKSR